MADFEVKDRGYDAAMAAFRAMDGVETKSGIVDNEETATYGLVWEARIGWLRDTTDKASKKIDSELVQLQNDLVRGKDGKRRAGAIASELAEEMRSAIASAGLEETGALIDSVTSEVTD